MAESDPWEGFTRAVKAFQLELGRSQAINVNSAALRDMARKVVQDYFRSARPELQALGIRESELGLLDDEMQGLLRLSNGRNAKRSYAANLRRSQEISERIEVEREKRLGEASAAGSRLPARSGIEDRILRTLASLAPGAALSYEQALRDLADVNRISFRGTANELREALRETLDILAPARDVMAVDGFKLEAGQTGPTQKQRVRHVLRVRGLGKTARQTPEAAASLVDELTASLTRASYERSSVAVHIASTRKDVLQMKMYVDSVLAELLEIHG